MGKFNHFDFFAPYYDRVIGDHRSEKLITLSGLPTSGYLLDVGGGTGRISKVLTDLAAEIILVDPSVGMLKQAK